MMKLMRPLVALAAIAGVLAACGDTDDQRNATPERGTPVASPTAYFPRPATPESTSTPATMSGETGLAGTVLIGPQCPVVREDEPCPDRPYEADIDVYEASDKLVAQVRSDANGEFFVPLAPGAYRLEPRSPGPLPYASPQEVTVIARQVAQVVVSYDSGIR
jgi:hypothetical protein